MLSKNYWYIGTLTALLVAMEVFAVLFLARRKWASRIVLWILAAYVLITESKQLYDSKSFSYAFSTISYWLIVVGVLVPVREVKCLSAAFGLLAGCIYVSGFLIYPDMMSHMGEFNIGYLNGYLTHDILIVCALLMYTQFEVKRHDVLIVGGAIAIVVLFAELGKYVFHWNDLNEFLVGVIEGSALKNELFPDLQLTWWWYILWYVAVVGLLWCIWEFIRFINKRLLTYGNNVMPGKLVW